jgi:glucose-1-phosphate adenylyltransferase
MIMAGGKGERLHPLTRDRSKPAVPFAGRYRIVDFVLSNFVNSEMAALYVLVQYKSQSLIEHLRQAWRTSGILPDYFITVVPPQMRFGPAWYRGTADAVLQNLNVVDDFNPDIVAIFGADHIYRMDIRQMVEFHSKKNAGVTIAVIPVDKKYAKEFGVIEVDKDGRIIGFVEKREDAPTMPGDPTKVLASMGNYIFSSELLLKMVYEDVKNPESSHDFGKDILPALIGKVEMFAYDFQTNRIAGDPPEGMPYWRDVGTLDAYYEASMDVRAIDPPLNLYNRQWPLRTSGYSDPPAKFAFDEEQRRGQAIDSMVSGGCIISGGIVKRSVVGRWVRVHSGALVEDSIVFDNVDIGRRAKIRRAIIEKNARIPEDAVIGYDLEEDAKHYHVTETGIVVVEGHRSPVPLGSITV